MDDGLYSTVAFGDIILDGAWPGSLKGNALRVREAARARMAVRCGVLFDVVSLVGALLQFSWKGSRPPMRFYSMEEPELD
jgi:hypothetical protein